MKGLRLAIALAASALTLGTAAGARAQDPLEAAEAALSQVDFAAVRARAQEAIEGGGLGPERLARAYELLGLGAAADGQMEPARDAYVRLLALAPDADPTRDLAPRLRSPFLEARGFWTSRRDRLSLEVTYVGAAQQLRIALSDPVHLGARVEVGIRPLGSGESFHVTTLDPQPFATVPLGEGERFEYYVALLDEHGNHVVDHGHPEAPEVAGEERRVVVGDDGASAGGSDDAVVIAIAVVAGVLAAGGIATLIAVPIATNTRSLAPQITVR